MHRIFDAFDGTYEGRVIGETSGAEDFVRTEDDRIHGTGLREKVYIT